ncbi:hypothetical protein B8W66_06930 [Mycobacterium decipiens]|uniref:Uncharacterized protein n=1 Tax=Mycobacterium decipiens TaxID=1430326 RepID=A0A1X2LXU6_9MYCO|nr:hypothetical protein B8W66_06930 [Mycobacterium decipiens]
MGQTRRLRRLGRHHCRNERVRRCTATTVDYPQRGSPAAQAVRRRRLVSLDRRHGTEAVRRRAVPIFPRPLSRAHRTPKAGAVSPTAADSARLVGQTGPWDALARQT